MIKKVHDVSYIDRVEDDIQQLEVGDSLLIKWLDACQVTNIRRFKQINDNKVFVSYKKSYGDFHAIKRDRLYKRQYLILITSRHNDKFNIVSIPVKAIVKIKLITKTQREKQVSNIGDQYLTGKNIQSRKLHEGIGEKL
jgi:hypothetical protein